jgi:hypothetical protein
MNRIHPARAERKAASCVKGIIVVSGQPIEGGGRIDIPERARERRTGLR